MKNAGARLRDYLAWRNADLLRKDEFAWRDKPLWVYTDTFTIALNRLGTGPCYTHLRVPVSVVDLPEDETYYLLAAHPGFLPIRHCQSDVEQLIRETDCQGHVSLDKANH